jgi:hypothetical protein
MYDPNMRYMQNRPPLGGGNANMGAGSWGGAMPYQQAPAGMMQNRMGGGPSPDIQKRMEMLKQQGGFGANTMNQGPYQIPQNRPQPGMQTMAPQSMNYTGPAAVSYSPPMQDPNRPTLSSSNMQQQIPQAPMPQPQPWVNPRLSAFDNAIGMRGGNSYMNGPSTYPGAMGNTTPGNRFNPYRNQQPYGAVTY